MDLSFQEKKAVCKSVTWFTSYNNSFFWNALYYQVLIVKYPLSSISIKYQFSGINYQLSRIKYVSSIKYQLSIIDYQFSGCRRQQVIAVLNFFLLVFYFSLEWFLEELVLLKMPCHSCLVHGHNEFFSLESSFKAIRRFIGISATNQNVISSHLKAKC